MGGKVALPGEGRNPLSRERGTIPSGEQLTQRNGPQSVPELHRLAAVLDHEIDFMPALLVPEGQPKAETVARAAHFWLNERQLAPPDEAEVHS